MTAKKITLGAFIIILFLGVCALIFYLAFYENKDYYTKIDNEKVEKIKSNDDFKYEYKLTTYDKYGKEKEITFQTTRVLKEDAYLKLKVMLTRGVISWEEINVENLPQEVKEKYNLH